jgi:hypothetical protein
MSGRILPVFIVHYDRPSPFVSKEQPLHGPFTAPTSNETPWWKVKPTEPNPWVIPSDPPPPLAGIGFAIDVFR